MGLPSDLTNMQPVDIGSAPTDGALFPIGKILASSLALREIRQAGKDLRSIITRHCNGQFGDCDMDMVFANQSALACGEEIGSLFYFDEECETETALCVWTSPDRTETRLMRRDEF